MSEKATFKTWYDKLLNITKRDPRYSLQAYYFIFEALDFTVHKLAKDPSSPKEKDRHVTGKQLLEGIRVFALQQFGYMSRPVLEAWGIKRCEDFGEIVFNLVENDLMGKTTSDTREDFKGGYDFNTAFDMGFKFEGKYDVKMDWNSIKTRKR
ncbi:MAG TPA: Minf_1886 family protein [Candidatus Hypogeohydataceae bacterium YC40]